jgi:hypothetical protein
MSTSDQASGRAQEPEWKRKRRLAAIFGDALPETTADDREEPGERRDKDSWLRAQVPPHHGKI